MASPWIVIGLFAGAGFLASPFPKKWKNPIFLGLLFLALISSILTFAPVLWRGGRLAALIHFPWPMGDIPILVDPLASFFLLMIAIMGFLGAAFGVGYLSHTTEETKSAVHFPIFGLFLAAMAGTVMVQSVPAFLILWEIMSLSSFFLVALGEDREEVRRAALHYFVAMHISFLFIAVAMIALAQSSGSFCFSDFVPFLSAHRPYATAILGILFVGFGIKAGFVPLHTWLPRAHPAAPSHVSGIMSGVMIKIGIYGILRFVLLAKGIGPTLAWIFLGCSLFSGLYGVMKAIPQHDIKKLLAYHSVENIGIIGIGIGAGLIGIEYELPLLAFWGFAGALLHILNHSIFKALLFYTSGCVIHQSGTRNVELLGGLAKRMPMTAFFFLVGALSITGLPLWNGFISEFMVYSGLIQGVLCNRPLVAGASILSIAGLAAIGAMALICFTKVFGIVFLGMPRSPQASSAREVSWTLLWPASALTLFCFSLGLWPLLGLRLVQRAAREFYDGNIARILPGIAAIRTLTRFIWFFAALLSVMFILRFLLLRGKSRRSEKTWSCGYPESSSRMQYTASSFAEPFVALTKPMLGISEKHQAPEGLFPEKAAYSSSSEDIFDRSLFHPILERLQAWLLKLSWVQGGHTQRYLLYGLLFLIAALVWMASTVG